MSLACSKGVLSAEWVPPLPVLATEHSSPPALFLALPNQVCSFSFWMLTDVVSVSHRWKRSLLSDLFISQHNTWAFSWAKTYLCRGAISWMASEDIEQISICFSAKASYRSWPRCPKAEVQAVLSLFTHVLLIWKKEALIRKIYNDNAYTHKSYNNDKNLGIILDIFKRNIYCVVQ